MFEPRASATEFLDRDDCPAELAAASYRFMERVNRHFGGIRTVRRHIAGCAAGRPAGTPLRILDIGSGSCDIPLAVGRWARQRDIRLHFTCLEKADQAVNIARRQLALAPAADIDLRHEDAFVHQPKRPYDCAVASMCLHHFADAEILELLERLRGYVVGTVLINDLRRSRWASLAARLLLAGHPAGVRHDALLSIRRGFRVGELSKLLRQLKNVETTVAGTPWFRVVGIVKFKDSNQ